MRLKINMMWSGHMSSLADEQIELSEIKLSPCIILKARNPLIDSEECSIEDIEEHYGFLEIYVNDLIDKRLEALKVPRFTIRQHPDDIEVTHE